jgi:hypothetical protein
MACNERSQRSGAGVVFAQTYSIETDFNVQPLE